MWIVFVKDYPGFAPGARVEFHPGAAAELVRRGVARPCRPPKPKRG